MNQHTFLILNFLCFVDEKVHRTSSRRSWWVDSRDVPSSANILHEIPLGVCVRILAGYTIVLSKNPFTAFLLQLDCERAAFPKEVSARVQSPLRSERKRSTEEISSLSLPLKRPVNSFTYSISSSCSSSSSTPYSEILSIDSSIQTNPGHSTSSIIISDPCTNIETPSLEDFDIISEEAPEIVILPLIPEGRKVCGNRSAESDAVFDKMFCPMLIKSLQVLQVPVFLDTFLDRFTPSLLCCSFVSLCA